MTEREVCKYGGQIIAKHLIETYGLQPFILSNGKLGIHFMNLSWSSDDGGETLVEQMRDEVRDQYNLVEWRNTLAEALSMIDAAIQES